MNFGALTGSILLGELPIEEYSLPLAIPHADLPLTPHNQSIPSPINQQILVILSISFHLLGIWFSSVYGDGSSGATTLILSLN